MRRYLSLLPGWDLAGSSGPIRREYVFSGFAAAVAFLGRLAPVANSEDHHPEFHLTRYRRLVVEYRTNSIGGLTENDFIMAAKTDALAAEA